MDKVNISKEDLFNTIKYGHNWHSEKIKEELDKLRVMSSSALNHQLRYDDEDKYYYIYDNECYIFVFDGKIEVRCDRENVSSEGKTFTYKIGEAKDILAAYEHFKSITMEDDEN